MNLNELRSRISKWDSYVKYHEKVYSSRHMAQAWRDRMNKIKKQISEWREQEVKIIVKDRSLYKRKTSLVQSLIDQMEFHQCEKERAIRKFYTGEEDLDYGIVEHHQREAVLLFDELKSVILGLS